MQQDLFEQPLERPPVMVAYGGGVDSTAMIIEMHARGEPIDQVLMALTLTENPLTDRYVDDVFAPWMAERGIPFEKVINKVSNFKLWPKYAGIYENCLTNGTLPSISFGFHSCSVKWKVSPQDKWVNTWSIGQAAVRQGMKIVKCIGYDNGPRDSRRYAEREGHEDAIYFYRYPLREYQFDRDRCIQRIQEAGLPVPPKSSCYVCCSTKPAELHEYPPVLLRRIVLLEARAFPRLRSVEGLWRATVKGTRGGTPRPGLMTQYIREQKLLPEAEIDLIWNEAPKALIAWQESIAHIPINERPAISGWLEFFDEHHHLFEGDGLHPLYPDNMRTTEVQAA